MEVNVEEQAHMTVAASSELDPCIAAESRMKQSMFSGRVKALLIISGIFLLTLLLLGIFCFLLFNSAEEVDTHDYSYARAASNGDILSAKESPFPPSNSIVSHLANKKQTTTSHTTTSSTLHTASEFETEPTTSPVTVVPSSSTTVVTEKETTMPPPTTSSTISTTTTKQENSDTSYHSETISVSFATTSSETEAFIATSPTGSTEFYSGTSQEHKNVPFNTEESEVIGQAILDGVLTDQSCLAHRGYELGSGVYLINPGGDAAFKVYCDMETDGGGWTVMQRRLDEQGLFHRKYYPDYVNGFGTDLMKNHWLGLNKTYRIVPQGQEPQVLRIELRGDSCNAVGCSRTGESGFWYGEWSFTLGRPDDHYPIYLSEQIRGNLTSSTARPSWSSMSNGMPFTTPEANGDRDESKDGNCAQMRNLGAWWHKDCTILALNGKYGDKSPKLSGLVYHRSEGNGGYMVKPLQTLMMIRPHT